MAFGVRESWAQGLAIRQSTCHPFREEYDGASDAEYVEPRSAIASAPPTEPLTAAIINGSVAPPAASRSRSSRFVRPERKIAA